MSDEDVCDHPACELVVTGFNVSEDDHRPGMIHTFVVVKCAMCGSSIELSGDLNAT